MVKGVAVTSCRAPRPVLVQVPTTRPALTMVGRKIPLPPRNDPVGVRGVELGTSVAVAEQELVEAGQQQDARGVYTRGG